MVLEAVRGSSFPPVLRGLDSTLHVKLSLQLFRFVVDSLIQLAVQVATNSTTNLQQKSTTACTHAASRTASCRTFRRISLQQVAVVPVKGMPDDR